MRILLTLVALFAVVDVASAQKPKIPPKITDAKIRTEDFVFKKTPQGDLTLHGFFPTDAKASEKRPVIVFFFGGGWKNGIFTQFAPQAEYLASRGIVALSADYRIESKHKTTPDIAVEDAKSAIRWVRANAGTLGIDPDKVIASGGSAGGHLAAATALVEAFDAPGDPRVSAKPNALVLFNPFLDGTNAEGRTWKGANGQDITKDFSPTLYLAKNTPPTIQFFGTDDKLLAHGEDYTARAQKLGVRAELYTAAKMGHGFFNRSPWLEITTRKMDEFLTSLGYLKGEPTLKLPKEASGLSLETKHVKTSMLKPDASKPNIVFLLADDLGYGDLHCMGHPYAQTPAIDQLAKEGSLFKHFYVSGATCCPSRAGLMTSQFPARFAKYPASFGFSGEPTVTEILKKNGYRTGHFGKWHIGPEEKNGTFGIDSIQVLGGNRRDATGRDSEIATAAVNFIKANKSGPFYVNVWFHSTHNPVHPPKSFTDKFANVKVNRADFPNPDMQAHLDQYEKLGGKLDEGMQNYLGEVLQLDGQVAKVLHAIDELGLRENTIVVFTSDNGPARCTGGGENATKPDPKKKDKPKETLKENMLGSAGLLRERKHSQHDGGIKQPFIIRWPGHVPAGRVDDTNVIAGVDWLPSLAGMAGILIDAARYDGENVSDIWLGGSRDRKRDLYWKASNPRDTPVMRRGNWKLHLPPNIKKDVVELYDLSKDPGERQNLAEKHPEVVAELTAMLRRWNGSLPNKYEKGEDNDD